MDIRLIPILSDNYCCIIHSGNEVAVVDPGDSEAVIKALHALHLSLHKILITHHHNDHTDGIAALKVEYDCVVYGPAAEAQKIAGLDHLLYEGDTLTIGNDTAQIIATSGHTLGHIAYWFPQGRALFAGDTLFSLGCGRLFEGTPQQMFDSLEHLKKLPDDTRLYCGHEYTHSNAVFALTQDPDNTALQNKMRWIEKQRQENIPTLPSLLGEEKALNPFLQCKNAEAFAELRRLKDQF